MRPHRMEGEPVTVPAPVLAGIEEVQRSGLTNLLDRPVVADLADMMGHPVAAEWIRANKSLYAEGIFRGFRVVPPSTFNWEATVIEEEDHAGLGLKLPEVAEEGRDDR